MSLKNIFTRKVGSTSSQEVKQIKKFINDNPSEAKPLCFIKFPHRLHRNQTPPGSGEKFTLLKI